MKTIEIKGKKYIPVVERVKEFHKRYPQGQITTEITSDTAENVAVKATISFPTLWKSIHDEKGKQIDAKVENMQTFTGHSSASKTTGIMKDVAMEVAETSAIGRALGFANIGLEDNIASADEMRKTVSKEDIKDDQDLFM